MGEAKKTLVLRKWYEMRGEQTKYIETYYLYGEIYFVQFNKADCAIFATQAW